MPYNVAELKQTKRYNAVAMFNFRKKEKAEETKPKASSWLQRLRSGLTRTRDNLSDGLANLVLGKKQIDEELLEGLETQLLLSDIGVSTTDKILQQLHDKIARKQLNDPHALLNTLKSSLTEILEPYTQPLDINTKPFVLLMVGVNGAGKTTSIAKLAHLYKQQGKQVMLAAGDTFRAAAIEQLQVWGERNDVPVIAQQSGADSASVIFDAMQATHARQYDILIADTAGRLHTQSHLMDELKKIKRVIAKIDEHAPHETMLVLDASMGQNALQQAKQFHEAIGLTGISLTKLDGTAKGGIVFTIADQMQLPLRFIGVGEQIDDLKPFTANEFVEALFADVNNVMETQT